MSVNNDLSLCVNIGSDKNGNGLEQDNTGTYVVKNGISQCGAAEQNIAQRSSNGISRKA